jgi:hypothetical protein
MKTYGGIGCTAPSPHGVNNARHPVDRRLCEPQSWSGGYGEENLLNLYTYQIARRQIPEELNIDSLMHFLENLKFR